jgi:hypothetical protein
MLLLLYAGSRNRGAPHGSKHCCCSSIWDMPAVAAAEAETAAVRRQATPTTPSGVSAACLKLQSTAHKRSGTFALEGRALERTSTTTFCVAACGAAVVLITSG